ncbi:MAG: UMP kinase [Pseudomonadales bacterium]|nr:UMP kinase [Pseudomonadales bacterium]
MRLLLKLSGEALAGELDFGIDPKVVLRIASEIRDVIADGVEVGVVLGGGNLFRGATLQAAGMDRVTGDHMGMLATIMNALALRDVLLSINVPSRVLSAVDIHSIVDGYSRAKAVRLLERGEVVIFGGGTSNPFFTTDSAASLRGIEIAADMVLKGTKVDGVYDSDPEINKNAQRYGALSFDEVIQKELKVMDLSAMTLCRDHKLPIVVFDMALPGALRDIAQGKKVGTVISCENNSSGTVA